jgi:hypothetical protein
MKTPLALLLSGLVLAGCKLVEPPPPPPPPPANGIGFFANCDMRPGTLELSGEGEKSQYTFSLKDKDIGRCDTDKLASKRAPYWERAELSQQGYLDLAEPQVLKFDARFRDGFIGKQENFLQIQNFNLACPATPSLMLKWHKGELELSLLQASGVLKPKRYPDLKVDDFRSWKSWQVRFARTSKTTMAIDVVSDGERIGRGHLAYMPECGTQYVKFGISRPGNSRDQNQTSIAQFRNFSLKTLNPPKKVTAKITAKGPPLRHPPEEKSGPVKLQPQDPPMMVKRPSKSMKTTQPTMPQAKDPPRMKTPVKNELMIARKFTRPLKLEQKDLPAKASAPKFSSPKARTVKMPKPAVEMKAGKLTITHKSSKPIVPATLTITHKSSTPLK